MAHKPSYEDLEEQVRQLSGELARTHAELKHERQESKEHRQGPLLPAIQFDSFPGIICIISSDRSFIYANDYCRLLFGKVEGQKAADYFRQDNKSLDPSLQARSNLTQSPDGVATTWRIKTDSGKKTFALYQYPITDVEGTPAILAMGIDVSEYVDSSETSDYHLRDLELQVKQMSSKLRKKDIALKEVFSQLEVEKQDLAEKVDINIQKVLLPIVEKLIEKASSLDSRYLMLIKQNLEQLTSSVGMKLSKVEYNLTPKEIELCALIKGGFSIKEIATMHNLSERTVETHRLNIRRKLGLHSAKINLSSYLSNL